MKTNKIRIYDTLLLANWAHHREKTHSIEEAQRGTILNRHHICIISKLTINSLSAS